MDTSNSKLIGIHGLAGSGKSLVAEYLEDNHDFISTKIAAPMKNMLAVLLCASGVCNTDNFLDYIEGDMKEEKIFEIGDVSPRYLMQTLGGEWGRDTINPHFWINIWSSGVSRLEGNVVVDDIRYTNEAVAVRGKGGYVIHIIREDRERDPGVHSSEHPLEVLAGDIVVHNDGSKYDLYRKINTIIKSI